MKKNWWKILGVLLILYSLLMGLLTPLRVGITDVSPSSAEAGKTLTLNVTGYNSFYQKNADGTRAWLKLDSLHAIAATGIRVLDDRQLEAVFEIPAAMPDERTVLEATLVIDHPADGWSVMPAAVFIKKPAGDSAQVLAEWPQKKLDDLHERKAIVFPFRNILYETIRNLYYHVPLWMAMFVLFAAGAVVSGLFLWKKQAFKFDQQATALTGVGVLYGILGLVTGAIWAKHTWGAYWSFDIKQNMSAVAMLIYGAYFVLRSSFEDPEKRARISAVYNIFAFATLIPLLYVIPKMTDSLHPGAGGNVAFGSQDLDNTMRLVFYPAIIGWALFGAWLAWLRYRVARLEERFLDG